MKPVPLPSPARGGILFGILNTFLAIGLTILSFQYVQPRDCYASCGGSKIACSNGGCGIGEQKAGWPLPVFVDAPGGGSPTGGWGLLGPEDIPNPVPLVLDVLFYSLLLWVLFYILQLVQKKTLPPRLIARALALNVFLASGLWLFLMVFPDSLSLGRGRSVSIDVDTPDAVFPVSGFSPIVSVPVGELLENYGEPDEARLHQAGTAETPALDMVLYWDLPGMYAELPPVAYRSYTVKKSTNVEMVLFFKEGEVVRIAGQPLGKKKTPWKGYGTYLP